MLLPSSSSFFFYCNVTTASTQILLANNVISELGFWTNNVTECVTSYEMKVIVACFEKYTVFESSSFYLL